ncbi:MAG: elongation factor Ts [Microscillaceae bacterium]|nr:elongation factor Ts [Microscillaceae bacterium]
MAEVTASMVKELRELTGAGMMDCKAALEEANGNFEEAVTILRKKGQKVSSKRADKEASEGAVFVQTNQDATEGLVLALNCETDFVAKNEEFLQMGQLVFNTALAQHPASVEALLQAEAEGRPVQDILNDFMGKVGEKIEISAYEFVQADKVLTYLHSNNKVGVLVGLVGIGSHEVEQVGKDIAMQIAAMKPVALDESDVPQEIKDREMEIGRELARQEGKPENIIDKVAEGKLKKFYQENTLLHQQFVKDNSKTIAQLLKEISGELKVNGFRRVEIGA